MAKVTIFHLNNERNVNVYDGLSIMEGMLDGEYYLAGEVEVDGLEQAWLQSQNDNHENWLERDGIKFGTYNDIVTEYQGDFEGAERAIKRRGYTVLPAVWNGEFAQRSSKVGDVFLLDGQLYMVAGCGFKPLAHGQAAEIMVEKMAANPWKPVEREINEEFDALVFIGD